MSDGITTQGTYIGTSDGGSPATYSELAEVSNIGGPNETSDEYDFTHLRSPGAYREFKQGFKDGGELPLTMNFVPGSASQTALLADYEATPSPVKSRRIFYPDGTTATFDSYVKGRSTPVQVATKLELSVTLRITGPVIWDRFAVSPALM
jgi:hypothetical protein